MPSPVSGGTTPPLSPSKASIPLTGSVAAMINKFGGTKPVSYLEENRNANAIVNSSATNTTDLPTAKLPTGKVKSKFPATFSPPAANIQNVLAKEALEKKGAFPKSSSQTVATSPPRSPVATGKNSEPKTVKFNDNVSPLGNFMKSKLSTEPSSSAAKPQALYENLNQNKPPELPPRVRKAQPNYINLNNPEEKKTPPQIPSKDKKPQSQVESLNQTAQKTPPQIPSNDKKPQLQVENRNQTAESTRPSETTRAEPHAPANKTEEPTPSSKTNRKPLRLNVRLTPGVDIPRLPSKRAPILRPQLNPDLQQRLDTTNKPNIVRQSSISDLANSEDVPVNRLEDLPIYAQSNQNANQKVEEPVTPDEVPFMYRQSLNAQDIYVDGNVGKDDEEDIYEPW